MKCKDAKPLMSMFLDGMVTGSEMRELSGHLEACADCKSESLLLSQTQRLVAGVGRKQPPAELALKLRVLASREVARSQRKIWEGLAVRIENAFNAFMVPATAGMVSAIITFGLLIGVLMPGRLSAANDVPTNLYTPPQLAFSPFGIEAGWVNAESIVVEAYVDSNGRVQDYRVLSAPENAKEIMPELNNMMIFTVFRPATTFGQPTSGRTILSFSKINVKG
jgi:Putative zinc-finger